MKSPKIWCHTGTHISSYNSSGRKTFLLFPSSCASSSLKYWIVLASPFSSGTSGSQFRTCRAFVMSGFLFFGSSVTGGLWTISDLLSKVRFTVSANSLMVSSEGFPRFTCEKVVNELLADLNLKTKQCEQLSCFYCAPETCACFIVLI